MNTVAAPSTSPAHMRRWPLAGMVFLAMVALGLVAWQRMLIGGPPSLAEPVPSWQRALHFADGADGSVVVLDAASGHEIRRYRGEQGFLRGTLRVLTHARQRRGLGSEQAFLITGYANGRVTLSDPATGERIHLESFGPSNVAVFAPLRDATALPKESP